MVQYERLSDCTNSFTTNFYCFLDSEYENLLVKINPIEKLWATICSNIELRYKYFIFHFSFILNVQQKKRTTTFSPNSCSRLPKELIPYPFFHSEKIFRRRHRKLQKIVVNLKPLIHTQYTYSIPNTKVW